MPGSVEFRSRIDDGEEQTVAVGPDGTAIITWTPERPYYHWIVVRSRTSAGDHADVQVSLDRRGRGRVSVRT
jgi:hypothetical protein